MSYERLRKGRWSGPGQVYLITTVTYGRHPYFADVMLGRRVVAEMRRVHEERLVDTVAWVLMPDHLHWLVQLGEGGELGTVMKLFKARSARAVNRALGRGGPLWQRAYHDHALRCEEDLRQAARYVVGNPLRARLVNHIGDYPLWDAVWLWGAE
jgi:putative transposase